MIYAPSSLFSTLPDVNFLFCFNKTITLENVLLSASETDFRTVLLLLLKYCCLSRYNVNFRYTGLVLAVLTGITLGIAMGMVLLVTVHCARYRYTLYIPVLIGHSREVCLIFDYFEHSEIQYNTVPGKVDLYRR